MLRLACIASLLEALVQSGDEHFGADTAVLSLYQTAELYAYATREEKHTPLAPKRSLMAYTPDTPLAGEERARAYSAIAVAAWRDHFARSGLATPTARTASRARPETPPEGRAQMPRRFASVHRQEASSGSDTPQQRALSSSVRFQPSESADGADAEERLSTPDTDGVLEPETQPIQSECEVCCASRSRSMDAYW